METLTSQETISPPAETVLWRSVEIACRPGCGDAVSGLVFEAGFTGLEEHGDDSGGVVFTAYFRKQPEQEDPLERLAGALDRSREFTGEECARIVGTGDVENEDWEKKWREGLKPIEVGSRLVVRPSWTDYDNVDERIQVVVDPKMAFGTGAHESTRLCLNIIEKMTLSDISVLDIGCGSGILAITAVKMGARCAIGFDFDQDSVSNAQLNLKSNRVDDRVQVYRSDLFDVEPGRFNLVVANVVTSVLIPNLGKIRTFLMPGGMAVFSGILTDEEDDIVKELKKKRYKIDEIIHMGEWVAIVTLN